MHEDQRRLNGGPVAAADGVPEPDRLHLSARIPADLGGRRLDQALAALFPDYSRARLQRWVREGMVVLDGRRPRPRDRVLGGEQVEIRASLELPRPCAPEDIPLEVVHEDPALFVIDKPAGMVVHPAAGHRAGTLQNALLHLDPGLERVPRAGIVHRLDKDTSGLLVVARTPGAHRALVAAMQARAIRREYEAVAVGLLTGGGRVEAPIGRHPVDRKRMAVVPGGRAAVTHYRVVARYRAHTWLRVRLETGRTHQIRVHMAHLRHPLVGDPVYGGRGRPPAAAGPDLRQAVGALGRQALHAAQLALTHPQTGQELSWESPLPADLQALRSALEADLAAAE